MVDHQASNRLIESIQDIQSSIGEISVKCNVNLSKLQSSSTRLFDSLFVYENYPNPIGVAQEKVKVSSRRSEGKLEYPLVVIAYEEMNELVFQLLYAGELFGEDTISHLLNLTITLLEQLDSNAYRAVSDLKYLNSQQYHQIIYLWNLTDKVYPADKTIHQLFEEQVAKTPDNVAIIYEEVQLTYKELNERTNQLAHYLIEEHNIKPDSLILLFLDRNEHMIIAILAVLKAGGAYVPIDPSYPDDRIKYMLQDTGSVLLLTNHVHQGRINRISCVGNTHSKRVGESQPFKVLYIDSQEFNDTLSLQTLTNPNTKTTSDHLAYVIYTSGTTGKSKGVMVEHGGVVNLNYALVSRYSFGADNDREVILQFSNYVFDLSVEQIILALLNGHVLLLIPNQLWFSKEAFNAYLFENKVTHIQMTPRFLEQHNFCEILSLKRVISAGEVLSQQCFEKIGRSESIDIINTYGPTETTVISSVKIVKKGDLNIGSPIPNTKCYVLDENLVPVPIGAIGELYIGGAGVARGYLNRPDLTAQRFIANPFQTEEEKTSRKNHRLYKTGDLVTWLPDGNLQYIERNDFQVKIRGYRIELGEIESALLGYEGIKQSVALAKEHKYAASASAGNKYLVGYYVSDSKIEEEAIFHYLESQLPDYMVPAILVHLVKLPLNVNGKLDQKALPDPEFTSLDNYVAPRNEIEQSACHIFAELLGLTVDKVGIYDYFFRLGGNSIISIQLVSRFQQKLQVNVSVKDIFTYKSIAKLYENIFKKQSSIGNVSSLHTEQGISIGAVPLLPIQEWFFWQNFSAAHNWNQSFLIETPELDLGKLQDSLDKLVQHHDCFRFRYKKDESSNTYEHYYNCYFKAEPLKGLDIRTLGYQENSQTFKTNLQELLTKWQENFDLTEGPTYSVGYIYGYQDGRARIHFALHRLILDEESWNIVTEDLRDLYYGRILGKKGSTYRQWALMIKDYPSNHQEEENYWSNILSDFDGIVLNNLIESKSTVHFTSMELSQEYTGLLIQESNQVYNTETNDLLLTALGYSLAEITGSNINHILLKGHGREKIDSSIDVTRTSGWFTTIYPVRLEIVDELGTSIVSIKESIRMIPHKGLGFGAIFGYKSNDLPRLSFNYLGPIGQEYSEKLDKENIWQIVGEDSGLSVNATTWDNNIINFQGVIMDGRLIFSIVSKLDVEVTDKLTRVFKKQILNIIEHCKNNSTIEYTMSDFKDFEPYVIFNQDVMDGNNLFILPPGDGGAECYFRNIVPNLRKKRLVLFNNYLYYLENKLGNNYVKHLTFEKFAEYYIPYIKFIQPKGPYNLFGWSFGGILAFEISKKLISRGDCVANLMILDSYFFIENIDLNMYSKIPFLDNLNSMFSVDTTEMPNTNIILFKATEVEEIDFYISLFNTFKAGISTEEVINIRHRDLFYTKKTKANNLDELLRNHKIHVVPINSTHYNWVYNDDAMTEICVRLEEL